MDTQQTKSTTTNIDAFSKLEDYLYSHIDNLDMLLSCKETITMARLYYKYLATWLPKFYSSYLVGVPLDLNVDKQIPEDKFLVSGADLYKGREEIIEQKLAMYQAILIAAIKDVPGFQDYLNTTLENSLAIVDQINSYTNDQNKFNNDFDNQYADWKDKNNSGGNTSGNNGGYSEA